MCLPIPAPLSRGLSALLFFFLIYTPISTTSAQERFKSQDEENCARMLGFTGSTINDAARKILINQEACEAYRFLLERNGTGTRDTGCYRSQTDRILKLNPGFAVGLYKALSEIEKLHGGKNIIQSGFRCAGGNHNKGCAADIIWKSCQTKTQGTTDAWRCSSDRFDAPEQRWIDENGKNEPYKIHLRLRYAPEGHHVEPTNTNGCTTGVVVGPSNAPSSALSNRIRDALGLDQQQQKQPPSPRQPALPPQPAIPPQPALPPQYSGTQPGQYFPRADTGEPIQSGTPVTPQITSNNGATTGTLGKAEYKPPISDQLLNLAYGTTAIGVSYNSATTVPLFVGAKDATSLTTTKTGTSTYATLFGSTSIVLNPTHTFIPANPYANTLHSDVSRSQLVLALETMKVYLLHMLDYLKPFGVRHENEEAPEYNFE